ncbi:MAG: PrgI family protein [Roseburia sp.]
MLSININRDVEQYQESIAFGLNGKQFLAAVGTLIVGVSIVCILYFGAGLSMDISIYAAIPFCIPLMLPVLKNRDGVSMLEQMKMSGRKKRILLYRADKTDGKRSDRNGRK